MTDVEPTGRATDDSPRLVCESCGREADRKAKGWRGLLGREDDDSATVVVLCPDCRRQEFEPDAQ